MSTRTVVEHSATIHTRYRTGEGFFLVAGQPRHGTEDVTVTFRGLTRAEGDRLREGLTLLVAAQEEVTADSAPLEPLPDPDAPITPAPVTVFVPRDEPGALLAEAPTEAADSPTE